MLHFHAHARRLAGVLDGVDEGRNHIRDLPAQFLVDLAVQRVDDCGVHAWSRRRRRG